MTLTERIDCCTCSRVLKGLSFWQFDVVWLLRANLTHFTSSFLQNNHILVCLLSDVSSPRRCWMLPGPPARQQGFTLRLRVPPTRGQRSPPQIRYRPHRPQSLPTIPHLNLSLVVWTESTSTVQLFVELKKKKLWLWNKEQTSCVSLSPHTKEPVGGSDWVLLRCRTWSRIEFFSLGEIQVTFVAMEGFLFKSFLIINMGHRKRVLQKREGSWKQAVCLIKKSS